MVNGFQTVEISVGSATYDLANKTDITVDAGDGADTMTIDNPTTADGVSSITLNGQVGDDLGKGLATAPGIAWPVRSTTSPATSPRLSRS